MASRYESFTNDEGEPHVYGLDATTQLAQTFTMGSTSTNVNITLSTVKLKVRKQGTPNNVTVSLRATDSNGKPTGSNLCTVTVDGNALSGSETVVDFTLAPSVSLLRSTKYAIIIACTGSSLYVFRSSDGSYLSGAEFTSPDGSTWTAESGYDLYFEIWGTEIIPAGFVGTGNSGSKYLKRSWPNVEGLTLGTTKLEGTSANLVEEGL